MRKVLALVLVAAALVALATTALAGSYFVDSIYKANGDDAPDGDCKVFDFDVTHMFLSIAKPLAVARWDGVECFRLRLAQIPNSGNEWHVRIHTTTQMNDAKKMRVYYWGGGSWHEVSVYSHVGRYLRITLTRQDMQNIKGYEPTFTVYQPN